jgi:hypothetical protein
LLVAGCDIPKPEKPAGWTPWRKDDDQKAPWMDDRKLKAGGVDLRPNRAQKNKKRVGCLVAWSLLYRIEELALE